MRWITLKEAVRDLGFEDDDIFDEYRDVIINSANRAIRLISKDVKGLQGYKEIIQDGTETGYRRLDLTEEEDYAELIGTPVIETDDGINDFSEYRVELDNTVVFDKSIKGKIRFFYKKRPTPITVETDDDDEIDLPFDVDVLAPLLTAYYVWLDDDKTKAEMYYNDYQVRKTEIVTAIEKDERNVRATVVGGVSLW